MVVNRREEGIFAVTIHTSHAKVKSWRHSRQRQTPPGGPSSVPISSWSVSWISFKWMSAMPKAR